MIRPAYILHFSRQPTFATRAAIRKKPPRKNEVPPQLHLNH